MAQPRKAPEEKREDRLNPRLTTAERAEIEQHAAILGISPSEFVRRRSLSYRLPASLALQRHVAALAVALLRLGVNLNQIARHMNAGRGPPPDLSALIARIEALLDDIYGPGDNGGRAQL
jgi:Bacterial mobilisation protein (MobC)